MKAYAPKYYKDFKCIANRCTHSCCVGWRIALDNKTRKLYSQASGHYSDTLRKMISKDEEGYYIPTLSCGRCPHLDNDGLCRVILEYGAGYLSDICREHPRYYNIIGKRVEVGLGASCPEAARLIISGEHSLKLTKIDADVVYCDENTEYSPLAMRDELANILDKFSKYRDAEAEILRVLGLPRDILCAEFRSRIFSELEYLYPENREMIFDAVSSGSGQAPDALIKVLAYFLYRHLSVAESEGEAVAAAAFALISTRTVGEITCKMGDVVNALRLYSEEIEYSTDNTESIMFDIQSELI